MNTQQVIKWGLIAAALYLGYRHLAGSGLLDAILGNTYGTQPGTGGAQPEPGTVGIQPGTGGTQPGTGAQPGTGGGTEPAGPTGPAPNMIDAYTQEQLSAAAADPALAGSVPNARTSIHGWNWYREQVDPALPRPSPEMAGVGSAQELTAVEYHAKLAQMGLSGLGAVGVGTLPGQARAWGRPVGPVAPLAVTNNPWVV